MASVNIVLLLGNLTSDPKLTNLQSGATKCDFGLAVNESYKNKDTGEWINNPHFFNVVTWAKMAELCAEHLHKGSLVHVEGSLNYSSWEKDGQKRSSIEVKGNRVQFLDKAQGKSGQSNDTTIGSHDDIPF